MDRSRRSSRGLVRSVLGAAGSLGALALAGSGLLERWTALSPAAALMLALVVVAASLWITEAVPLFVTSLFLLLLELAWLRPVLSAGGRDVAASAFLAPFFSNIILLFLGGFALSAAFRKYQLDEDIAHWVLERTGGKPRRVLAAVIGVTALLSMWMSNTATAAMMLGLVMPMLARVPEGDPFRRALPLGIAFGANLGGVGTPIGTPPNAIAIEAMKASGQAPSFGVWMAMALPLVLLFLATTWYVLIRLFPTAVEHVSMDLTTRSQPTRTGHFVVAVTLLTALLWLSGELHPLDTGTVSLVPVVTFFGLRILDRDDFLRLPWDVLILAGGGLSLGAALEVSGLGIAIVELIPSEELGMLGLSFAFALVAGLMTTFMSNTATANLLVPVVSGLAGATQGALLMVVAYACSCAMVLPVSTPPNAMVFSSGYLQTHDLVRPALILTVLALLATCLVGPSWWSLVGL